MARVAFSLTVRPELIDEYIARHSPVWPEMLAEIAAAGRCNYSLFLDRSTATLFGYYETDDDAAAQAYLASSEVAARWGGLAPSVALHIPWDKVDDYSALRRHAEDLGVTLGTINSNTFQDEDYKFGALTHHDAAIRQKAIDHHLECIDIMDATGSDVLDRLGGGDVPRPRGPRLAAEPLRVGDRDVLRAHRARRRCRPAHDLRRPPRARGTRGDGLGGYPDPLARRRHGSGRGDGGTPERGAAARARGVAHSRAPRESAGIGSHIPHTGVVPFGATNPGTLPGRIRGSMPYRNKATVQGWVDDYLAQHPERTGSVTVLEKDFTPGPESGMVVVALRNVSTITYIQAGVDETGPHWLVTFEPRTEGFDMDAAGVAQLSEDLLVVAGLCDYLQVRTDEVMAAKA